jgi:hypothetical protein
MLTFTLVTEFSQVLIDTRDRYIILPRPVSDKTLLLSRLLHVFAYLFRTVLPMAIPGWIACGVLIGVAGVLWFPVTILLLVLLVLFTVNALYVILLRVTTPQRFKEVLNYFQIGFSVLVFAAYYLLPRLVDSANIMRFNAADHPGIQGAPTYWIAATWTWVGVEASLANTRYIGIIAIILPCLLAWVLVRFLAPDFARRIGGLDTSSTTEDAVHPGKSGTKNRSARWAKLFTRHPETRAGFMLTWIQSGRSRSFRMRVLPTFAYVPVYFVYLLSSSDEGFSRTWAELADTRKHLVLLYMTSFVLLQALSYITLSDQFKAAWVFRAAPAQVPGRIMAGAFKAVWVKFFLPFFIAISAFVLTRWGLPAILDIVLALTNVTLFGLLTARLGYRQLPFSIPEQLANSGNRTVLRVFIGLLVPGTLGTAHYFASDIWWLKILFLILSFILLWLVWDSHSGTTWSGLDKTATED